jgi:hypothetical protein
MTGFKAVRDVVIISDNDDPTMSFADICAQIERARAEGNLTRNWGAPAVPGVKAIGEPSVSVWMWPASELAEAGCLETLLWRYIKNNHTDYAACVEDACRCTKINNLWPKSKLDKAKVRCFLSLE